MAHHGTYHPPSFTTELWNDWRDRFFGGVGGAYVPVQGTMNQYERVSVTWQTGHRRLNNDYWVASVIPWLQVHYEVLFGIIALYLLMIVRVQNYMKTREAFTLRVPLMLWNFGLAIYSVVSASMLLTKAYQYIVIEKHGLAGDICSSNEFLDSPLLFWFLLSKIFELVDTLFLVLRKRPVIFLHWYHHAATFYYAWDAYAWFVHVGAWATIINLVVHSVMYSYYSLMTFPKLRDFFLKYKFIPQIITGIQITQMVIGLALFIWTTQSCPTTYLASDFRVASNLYYAIGMYVSYFALFIMFFIRRYIQGPAAATKQVASSKDSKQKPTKAKTN